MNHPNMAVSDSAGHHAVRNIKRSEGHSAVKAAAYLTGARLFDERIGRTFGRAEKAGRVVAAEVVGPSGTAWTQGQVWGAAERAEKRSNARPAQVVDLALPHELDKNAHRRLLRGFALWNRDTYGVAVAWALHAPPPGGDARNTHGHLLRSTRKVSAGPDGRPVFGEKVRALTGREARAELETQRAEWARRVNAELERAGLAVRVDHRSHQRRAEAGDGPPEQEPGQHLGPRWTAQKRRAEAGQVSPKAREAVRTWTTQERARGARNAARRAAWVVPASKAQEAAGDAQAARFWEKAAKAGEREKVAEAYEEARRAAEAERAREKEAWEWEQWRRRQQGRDD